MNRNFYCEIFYIGTEKKRNTIYKGTFTFDAATNLLHLKTATKAIKFIVSFNNDHLILTGELESCKGNKGALVIEYEKI